MSKHLGVGELLEVRKNLEPKVVFIDSRPSIVKKIKELGFSAINADYFKEILDIPRHVVVSASNPHWTFGGGFDLPLQENFPHYCYEKRKRGGGNERMGNICFTITVDKKLDSNEGLVMGALQFAKANTGEGETLCLFGLGTGIGNLNEDTFVEMFNEVFSDWLPAAPKRPKQ